MTTFAVKTNQNSIVHHILKLPLYILIVANDRLCDVEKELISGSALRIGHLIINRIEGNTNQVQEVVRIQLLRRVGKELQRFKQVPIGAIWCHMVPYGAMTHATTGKGLSEGSGRRLRAKAQGEGY